MRCNNDTTCPLAAGERPPCRVKISLCASQAFFCAFLSRSTHGAQNKVIVFMFLKLLLGLWHQWKGCRKANGKGLKTETLR